MIGGPWRRKMLSALRQTRRVRTYAAAPTFLGDPLLDHADAVMPLPGDGRQAEAAPGESIWQVAKRIGIEIPSLYYSSRFVALSGGDRFVFDQDLADVTGDSKQGRRKGAAIDE